MSDGCSDPTFFLSDGCTDPTFSMSDGCTDPTFFMSDGCTDPTFFMLLLLLAARRGTKMVDCRLSPANVATW
eukprot:704041-Pelagomonas_calceolata.AAC.4